MGAERYTPERYTRHCSNAGKLGIQRLTVEIVTNPTLSAKIYCCARRAKKMSRSRICDLNTNGIDGRRCR
jgi:hypothetical protein